MKNLTELIKLPFSHVRTFWLFFFFSSQFFHYFIRFSLSISVSKFLSLSLSQFLSFSHSPLSLSQLTPTNLRSSLVFRKSFALVQLRMKRKERTDFSFHPSFSKILSSSLILSLYLSHSSSISHI